MADLPAESRATAGEPLFTRVGMYYYGPIDVNRGVQLVELYT